MSIRCVNKKIDIVVTYDCMEEGKRSKGLSDGNSIDKPILQNTSPNEGITVPAANNQLHQYFFQEILKENDALMKRLQVR